MDKKTCTLLIWIPFWRYQINPNIVILLFLVSLKSPDIILRFVFSITIQSILKLETNQKNWKVRVTINLVRYSYLIWTVPRWHFQYITSLLKLLYQKSLFEWFPNNFRIISGSLPNSLPDWFPVHFWIKKVFY